MDCTSQISRLRNVAHLLTLDRGHTYFSTFTARATTNATVLSETPA